MFQKLMRRLGGSKPAPSPQKPIRNFVLRWKDSREQAVARYFGISDEALSLGRVMARMTGRALEVADQDGRVVGTIRADGSGELRVPRAEAV